MRNKKAIGIMLAVIMAVSVFAAVIPGTASELSNTPATAEQTEKIGIEEHQQRIYDQGYNYTIAENWITCLSPEDRKALCGYKHLKAPTEPLPENVRFVSDVPKAETKIGSLPSSYDAMAPRLRIRASEPSNTPVTTEPTEEIGIEELQQRIYDQGYNYTVAENWITRLSPEDREALCGYKHLKAPTEPLPENVRFVSDVP